MTSLILIIFLSLEMLESGLAMKMVKDDKEDKYSDDVSLAHTMTGDFGEDVEVSLSPKEGRLCRNIQ